MADRKGGRCATSLRCGAITKTTARSLSGSRCGDEADKEARQWQEKKKQKQKSLEMEEAEEADGRVGGGERRKWRQRRPD